MGGAGILEGLLQALGKPVSNLPVQDASQERGFGARGRCP